MSIKKIKKVAIIKPGAAPDVDTDIAPSGRDKVIDYVVDKYGADKVSNIITFGKMKTKESLKAIGKVKGVSFQEMNKITQMLPGPIDGKECTVADIRENGARHDEAKDLYAKVMSNKLLSEVFDDSERILNRIRAEGVHACFVGDTLVLTDKGYKQIKDIQKEDKVLTHKNVYKPVVDTIITKNNKGYELYSANGPKILGTYNHPFYVLSDKTLTPQWKTLEEIYDSFNTQEKLYLGSPINNNSILPDFGIEELKQEMTWFAIGQYTAGNNKLVNNRKYEDFLISFDGFVIPEFVVDLPIPHLTEFLEGYISHSKVYSDDEKIGFVAHKKETVLNLCRIVNKVYKTNLNVYYLSHRKKYICSFSDDNICIEKYNHLWTPVFNIRKQEIEEDTYNLTVIDDSSYVANNLTVHNCGVIISSEPLTNTIPTQVRQEDNTVVTQWDYPSCEALGLIKMDFLGLDTIDIIDNTVKNIEETTGEKIDIEKLQLGDLNDSKTFKLFQDGKTSSIFQFSGEGVQALLRDMKPTVFDDLAATTALYRPGPMGMGSHIRYSKRKNDLEAKIPVHKDFSKTVVEEILEPTHGLIVYQESVLRIATMAAGFTSVEADSLRKAIGKKKMDLMRSMKPKFINGILTNLKVSEAAANLLWDTIEEQGKYSFNKSHSISYALNAYTSGYLKANYPKEYMASILEQSVNARDKHLEYLLDTKKMGLKINGIDINKSFDKIKALKKNKENIDIQYGFNSIKGITKETLHEIIEKRKKGDFKDIIDFMLRVDIKDSQLKLLALTGAFDCFGISRRSVYENSQKLIDASKIDKKTSSVGLFSMVAPTANSLKNIKLTEQEYDFIDKARKEADLLGTFISINPLDNIKRKGADVDLLQENLDGKSGIVVFSSIKEKSGKNFSIFNVVADSRKNNNNFRLGYVVTQGIRKQRLLNATRQLTQEEEDLVNNDSIECYDELKTNTPYEVEFKKNKYDDSVQISHIKELVLNEDGACVIEMELNIPVNEEELKQILKKLESAVSKKDDIKGDTELVITGVVGKEKEVFKTGIKLKNYSTTYVYLHSIAMNKKGQRFLLFKDNK